MDYKSGTIFRCTFCVSFVSCTVCDLEEHHKKNHIGIRYPAKRIEEAILESLPSLNSINSIPCKGGILGGNVNKQLRNNVNTNNLLDAESIDSIPIQIGNTMITVTKDKIVSISKSDDSNTDEILQETKPKPNSVSISFNPSNPLSIFSKSTTEVPQPVESIPEPIIVSVAESLTSKVTSNVTSSMTSKMTNTVSTKSDYGLLKMEPTEDNNEIVSGEPLPIFKSENNEEPQFVSISENNLDNSLDNHTAENNQESDEKMDYSTDSENVMMEPIMIMVNENDGLEIPTEEDQTSNSTSLVDLTSIPTKLTSKLASNSTILTSNPSTNLNSNIIKKCDRCDRHFTNPNDYLEHQIHINRKSAVMKYCNMPKCPVKFCTSEGLILHLKKRHGAVETASLIQKLRNSEAIENMNNSDFQDKLRAQKSKCDRCDTTFTSQIEYAQAKLSTAPQFPFR